VHGIPDDHHRTHEGEDERDERDQAGGAVRRHVRA
jgi:hypothetical protein